MLGAGRQGPPTYLGKFLLEFAMVFCLARVQEPHPLRWDNNGARACRNGYGKWERSDNGTALKHITAR